ncbi:hypothetical protein DFH09DRAFT_1433713 [Mycena vulgaris]|nr:hypothetical protein DFH09DRAFT_1433713 [Mycena vulgaris]
MTRYDACVEGRAEKATQVWPDVCHQDDIEGMPGVRDPNAKEHTLWFEEAGSKVGTERVRPGLFGFHEEFSGLERKKKGIALGESATGGQAEFETGSEEPFVWFFRARAAIVFPWFGLAVSGHVRCFKKWLAWFPTWAPACGGCGSRWRLLYDFRFIFWRKIRDYCGSGIHRSEVISPLDNETINQHDSRVNVIPSFQTWVRRN